MKQFEYRKGTGWPVDAQIVGERLEYIEHKYGKITPNMVVKDAKKSVLKPCFEPYENNEKAAQLFREHIARRLIGSIVTVNIIPSGNEPIRTFVNVKTLNNDHVDQGYISIDIALGNPEFKSQIIAEAHAEMTRFIKKYKAFKELADYIEGIEQIALEMEAEIL